ncbi:hypothetical protein EUTSA_v10023111mg [Eutrema salsugineum]|uniref:Embryo surrounding factor 1 brassicaceae domain-containing protein n=1 Tax=Eutrema salsugineum TaxID=72664 RepID=V4M7P9_EUTSA|nr:hypothetical protein EUTSA_v10023111mg [Eutrema salsugineum]
MNNLRVTIAVLLATLVFTSTFSNSIVEAKEEIIISFKCKNKSECLTNIAYEACVDCRWIKACVDAMISIKKSGLQQLHH